MVGRPSRSGSDVRSAVRIVAGEWAARFLAPRLSALAHPHGDLSVSLAESHLDPDLDRCEADLFVRDGLPVRGRLVRTELGAIATAGREISRRMASERASPRAFLTALVGVGYFFVWTVFGMAAFPLDVALAAVEMR